MSRCFLTPLQNSGNKGLNYKEVKAIVYIPTRQVVYTYIAQFSLYMTFTLLSTKRNVLLSRNELVHKFRTCPMLCTFSFNVVVRGVAKGGQGGAFAPPSLNDFFKPSSQVYQY